MIAHANPKLDHYIKIPLYWMCLRVGQRHANVFAMLKVQN